MFKPSFCLRNRHIQTLFPALFRKQNQPKTQVEVFELEDGDFVDCYWHKNIPQDNKDIVILFHGLEGSYKSSYIKGIMVALESAGFHSVLMHFRGCSGRQNRLPRAYHSGDTADAKAYIESLAIKHSHSKLHAIGYSLGGNMLLKLLGEWKENSPLQSAISISAPMQLDISAATIDSGFAKIYQKHLLKHLKNSLLEKYAKHDMKNIIGISKKEVQNIATIRDFDNLYTAKIHGFKTAENYYKLSSAKQYLKHIKTKTLILHALDDPFMTNEILPTKKELSSHIELQVERYGGHVGFVSGTIFNPTYWLEKRIVDFLTNQKR